MDDFCGVDLCGKSADVLDTSIINKPHLDANASSSKSKMAGTNDGLMRETKSSYGQSLAVPRRENADDLIHATFDNDLELTEEIEQKEKNFIDHVEAVDDSQSEDTGRQMEEFEEDFSQSAMSTTEIVIRSSFEGIKYIISLSLLFFSVFLIIAAMFTEQTKATERGVHPAATFCLFSFLIVWLALMEGGQGCLVGLQPVTKSLYANSHPQAFKTAELAHRGDNMERFVVGRQFLVVLVIFVINIMSATVETASILNIPDSLIEIFLGSGIAVILTTVIVGQLTAQVNGATCMLDFINNYFMLFTVYVSLAIEMSGLLHSVYLINIIFSRVSNKPVQSNESSRNTLQKSFFWVRVLFSLGILVTAFAVTLNALFAEKTMMWEGIPNVVSVVLFFFLMCFAGVLDGLQIALFAVVNLPEADLEVHHLAHRNCQLVFSGDNLGAFLIGRQICVTVCMFVVARITSINVDVDDENSDNIFGVNNGLQIFFNTGLLGAIITTIVASLAWRVVASSFPIAFLSNPLVFAIIQLCLLLEKSGICSASWTLARIQKKLLRFHPDEDYLGKLGTESKKSSCTP